tara:strand:- start:1509 stop:1667 length:159 start_codon:yes stop_codon:yes gene_type:complete
VYKLIRRKPFLDINGLVLKDSFVPKSENKPYLDYAPRRVNVNALRAAMSVQE